MRDEVGEVLRAVCPPSLAPVDLAQRGEQRALSPTDRGVQLVGVADELIVAQHGRMRYGSLRQLEQVIDVRGGRRSVP